MTESQEKIYNYILKYKEKHGEVPPSGTVAKYFKVSRQYIEQVYNQLIKAKILRKKAIVSRYELTVDNSLAKSNREGTLYV